MNNVAARHNTMPWQHYIAERDDLFLRSRSVSVTEMTKALAHELNQPLGSVTNILHGLKLRMDDGVIDNKQCYEAIDLALQQAQFAARVVARMRDFTESIQPDFVQFNVVDLLNHSVRLLDWVFSSDAVRIILTAAPHSQSHQLDAMVGVKDPAELMVIADYTMTQQIFTNLLRNASDALRDSAKQRKTIRVTVGRVREGIKIEIKDNGHGLRGLSAEDLFKPFQSTKKEGMGVGLSICKSFIELHQGKLWITQNEDAGCTAHVVLRAAVSGDKNE